ncbi:S8 family serine peptidase [Cohnella hongkongensis]|uniref:S8 family serine peptidase n=1 Tax=Cohnella hongkongensis TaxID=178337 RepID=A0ABV9FCT6_9BACL
MVRKGNRYGAGARSLGTGRRIALTALSALLCGSVVFVSPISDTKVTKAQSNVHTQAIGTDVIRNAPALIAPDPEFIKTIGISEAWALLDRDVTSTIAIIDTGIDYQHPELKPYLLPGINLIDSRKSAQDDNGHGTAVAGVIATAARVGEFSPGRGRWKGKLLPVKALDEFGAGNEEKLTQGIRLAVNQGADIIVLSLGLRRDALTLRDAVAYAESQGVLLIAASGNDAAIFGEAAAVQYPAAYPSVLSVVGIEGNRAVSSSTAGPENDIGAPWRVQTMAIGGGGIEMEGTSMGAPQIAVVAAMLKAAHPDWKPLRIRETLRRSATPLNVLRPWAPNTGYGLVSATKALLADDTLDWRESNNSRARASEFPLGAEVAGVWEGRSEADWFVFEAMYDGVFSLSGDNGKFSLYGSDGKAIPPEKTTPEGVLAQWPVKKGRNWLLTQMPDHARGSTIPYRLVSGFSMNPDASEPNDTSASAAVLPARNQQWTGTFHRRGDVDWFVVTLPKPGTLKLTITPDTTRIDPELRIHPAGGKMILVDERGDGGIEYGVVNNAKAGKYYFRISNAVSSNPEAVIGTYVAAMEYITEKEDLYEPNDTALSATPISFGKGYNGLIQTIGDQDWYRFTLTKKTTVKLGVSNIPSPMGMSVELRDKKLQTLQKWNNGNEQKSISGEVALSPNTYYIRVTGDRSNRNQYYTLKLE